MIEKEFWSTPDSWSMKHFEDVSRTVSGKAFDSSRFSDEDKDGYTPVIRIRDIHNTDTESYTDEDFETKYEVESGDLLVGMDGNFESSFWKGENAALNQRVLKIESVENVRIEWIKFWLDIVLPHIHKQVPKATVKHLSVQKHLNPSILPVPPLDEQERIVEEVEERLERVKRLENSVNSINQLSNEYEDSLLAFLFAGRDNLDSEPINTELTKEDIPENWTIKKIGDVGRFLNGRTLPKKDINGGSYPVYGANGIIGYHDEEFIDEKCLAICQRGATTGVVNTVSPPAWVTGNSIICWPENINYSYLKMYLSNYNFDKQTTKSTIKMLSQKNLKSVKIPVPPLEEQREIVEQVEKVDFKEVETSVDVLEKRFEEYRASVLAHAFQGDMDY